MGRVGKEKMDELTLSSSSPQSQSENFLKEFSTSTASNLLLLSFMATCQVKC
jgi:hypothetical protein